MFTFYKSNFQFHATSLSHHKIRKNCLLHTQENTMKLYKHRTAYSLTVLDYCFGLNCDLNFARALQKK